MAAAATYSLESIATASPFRERVRVPHRGHLRLGSCRSRRGGSFMTQRPTVDHEVRPEHQPIVPLPQAPFIPKGQLQSLVNLFPADQFVRYLCVGVFNTVFGYISFVVVLTLLNAMLPARLLYLAVILASVLSMPLNITVSYLGYKFFVFRTKGNFLGEWLKCFAVYGTGMIPGLVALSALTRFLQSVIHRHAAALHSFLSAVEHHLNGR